MKKKLLGAFAVLLALLVPIIYVVRVRWAWLNAGQSSGALQVALSLILGAPTLIFVVFASVAALQSAEASEAQARAANAQAESAKAQTLVSESQLEIGQHTLKEQTRPILNLKRLNLEIPWYEWGQVFEITNNGRGTAHKIEVAPVRADRSAPWGIERVMSQVLVAPGQSIPIQIEGGGYASLRFSYQSLAGHRYTSNFHFLPDSDMVTIYRESSETQELLETDLNLTAMREYQAEQRRAGAEARQ